MSSPSVWGVLNANTSIQDSIHASSLSELRQLRKKALQCITMLHTNIDTLHTLTSLLERSRDTLMSEYASVGGVEVSIQADKYENQVNMNDHSDDSTNTARSTLNGHVTDSISKMGDSIGNVHEVDLNGLYEQCGLKCRGDVSQLELKVKDHENNTHHLTISTPISSIPSPSPSSSSSLRQSSISSCISSNDVFASNDHVNFQSVSYVPCIPVMLSCITTILSWHHSILTMYINEFTAKQVIIDGIFAEDHRELQHSLTTVGMGLENTQVSVNSLQSSLSTSSGLVLGTGAQNGPTGDQMQLYLSSLSLEAYVDQSMIDGVQNSCNQMLNTHLSIE